MSVNLFQLFDQLVAEDPCQSAERMLQISDPPPRSAIVAPVAVSSEVGTTQPKCANILIDAVRQSIMDDSEFVENEMFTKLRNTCTTTSGSVENVLFNEAEFINRVEPDADFVVIKCNFGTKQYAGYREDVPVKTTKRGRKKKEKPVKNRKCQGDGKSFNSQISFYVRTRKVNVEPGAEVPLGTPVYKFKIFRNGKISLPGANKRTFDDIAQCARLLAERLDKLLYADEPDPAKHVRLVNIGIVMENFKYRFKMSPNCVVSLSGLESIFGYLRANPSSEFLPIADMGINARGSLFYVYFAAPQPHKPSKQIRLNIYLSGKINILGGLHDETTKKIYECTRWVFRQPDAIVDKNQRIGRDDNIAEFADVFNMSIETYLMQVEARKEAAHRARFALPELTEADVLALQSLVVDQ